jgi:predicted O-methyltransferase YrrM
MDDFQVRIDRLDIGLFQHVPSQTTENERKALLALQLTLRRLQPFVYLEIGSYLGGSLQPYLLDCRCNAVISIDPRPEAPADARGFKGAYGVSLQDMLNGLKKIPGADMKKLHNINASTGGLSARDLPQRPDICFIDGEHTDMAVVTDSRFCLSVLGENGLIVFHDANLVYGGIETFVRELATSGRSFRAFNFLDSVFFIELGNMRVSEAEPVCSLLSESYRGYLWSLAQTDHYRTFYLLPVCRFYRWLKIKIWDRIVRRIPFPVKRGKSAPLL